MEKQYKNISDYSDGNYSYSLASTPFQEDINFFLSVNTARKIKEFQYRQPIYEDESQNPKPLAVTSHIDRSHVHQYLKKKLPLTYILDGRELKERQMDVDSIISENFDIKLFGEDRRNELIFNIDLVYKLALQNFMGNTVKQVKYMIYGNDFQGGLPKQISPKNFMQDSIDHPYNQNLYRRKNALNIIQAYIGKEEFANIKNRLEKEFTSNTTLVEANKIDKKNKIFDIISKIYTESPIHLIRSQVTESIFRNYLRYISIYHKDFFCKELRIEKKGLENIRIFSTNQIDDIKNGTDYIIQLEYFNKQTKQRYEKSVYLDLKSKERSSNIHYSNRAVSMVGNTGVYRLSQNGYWERSKGEIISFINRIQDTPYDIKKDSSYENKLIKFLDTIGSYTESMIGGLAQYDILLEEKDRIISYVQDMYTDLEDNLLSVDRERIEDTMQILNTFYLDLESYLSKIQVGFHLPNSRQGKVELGVSKLLMSNIFEVMYSSISRHGFINYTDPLIRNRLDQIVTRHKETYKTELYKTLSASA